MDEKYPRRDIAMKATTVKLLHLYPSFEKPFKIMQFNR